MLESEKLTRICHLREAHKEDSKGDAADPVGNSNEMEELGDSAEVPPRPSREVTEERFEIICKCPEDIFPSDEESPVGEEENVGGDA